MRHKGKGKEFLRAERMMGDGRAGAALPRVSVPRNVRQTARALPGNDRCTKRLITNRTRVMGKGKRNFGVRRSVECPSADRVDHGRPL